MNKEELLKIVDELNFPKGEYYLLSSSVLMLYGVREKINDVDICISEKLFEEIKTKYQIGEPNNCGFYNLNEKVEVVVNETLDYDYYQGYPVEKLTTILNFKKNRNLPKDQPDIINIEKILESSNISISSGTIKNTKAPDKPNEDSYINNNNIFILLDGVSRDKENGIYPNPSPSEEVVKILTNSIYQYILKNQFNYNDINKLIKDSIINSNKLVKDYNMSKELSFKAGAVGIIMYLKDNKLYYNFIGDCVGITVTDSINKFTYSQTDKVHEHSKEFTKEEIRNVICNNINHPCGYGVLNGDEKALDFVIEGIIDIKPNMSIILTSDGLEDYINSSNIDIKSKSSSKILEEAIIKNNINQDDRTIIKIDFK